MDSKNLVPKNMAFLFGIIIPVSFVLYVDWVKKRASSKLIKEKNDEEYIHYKIIEFQLKNGI